MHWTRERKALLVRDWPFMWGILICNLTALPLLAFGMHGAGDQKGEHCTPARQRCGVLEQRMQVLDVAPKALLAANAGPGGVS